MNNYRKSIEDTLSNGEFKENRTGIKCLTNTPQFFKHDMRDGFPLLTEKFISLKNIAVELEAFIFGITDKKWLQNRGCNIWDSWKNPKSEDTDDLGPIYGFQWRRFNQKYEKNSFRLAPHFDTEYDQLANVIKVLKENPNDRRLVVSAWNPLQKDTMALPPCHLIFILQHINGKLSLNWVQRSVDSFLGLPYNIASYALLLELIAKEVEMQPYMLTGDLVDFHIYENHIEQCYKMLQNQPFKLPSIKFSHNSFWDWDHTKVELLNYHSHDKITAKVAV